MDTQLVSPQNRQMATIVVNRIVILDRTSVFGVHFLIEGDGILVATNSAFADCKFSYKSSDRFSMGYGCAFFGCHFNFPSTQQSEYQDISESVLMLTS